MDWQLVIVIGTVALALLYLGRAAWRSWRGAKHGCAGGCDCAVKTAGGASGKDRRPLIPLEQISPPRS
jgi:hypothetical protein